MPELDRIQVLVPTPVHEAIEAACEAEGGTPVSAYCRRLLVEYVSDPRAALPAVPPPWERGARRVQVFLPRATHEAIDALARAGKTPLSTYCRRVIVAIMKERDDG